MLDCGVTADIRTTSGSGWSGTLSFSPHSLLLQVSTSVLVGEIFHCSALIFHIANYEGRSRLFRLIKSLVESSLSLPLLKIRNIFKKKNGEGVK